MKLINMPKGYLALKTIAMPCDSNFSGNAFGGWIMSQIDIAGAIFIKQFAIKRVVTANVTNLNFIQPIHIGDVVNCFITHIKTRKSSISLTIQVFLEQNEFIDKKSHALKKYICACDAVFTYVNIEDNKSKSLPIQFQNIDTAVDEYFNLK